MKHGRVFDTNVLFAAQFTNGLCARLYEEALRDEPPITSDFILDELEEKLVSKLRLSAAEATAVRKEIASECRQVQVTPLERPICRDPDDDMILATALAAEAECIVTGDKDSLTRTIRRNSDHHPCAVHDRVEWSTVKGVFLPSGLAPEVEFELFRAAGDTAEPAADESAKNAHFMFL